MENAVQREKKFQAVNFGRRTPTSHYKLDTPLFKWVEQTKYLVITT